jgi:hypothetical protein
MVETAAGIGMFGRAIDLFGQFLAAWQGPKRRMACFARAGSRQSPNQEPARKSLSSNPLNPDNPAIPFPSGLVEI